MSTGAAKLRKGMMVKMAPSLSSVSLYLLPALQSPRSSPPMKPIRVSSPPIASMKKAMKSDATAEENSAEESDAEAVGAWVMMLLTEPKKPTPPATASPPPTTMTMVRMDGTENVRSTLLRPQKPMARIASAIISTAPVTGRTKVMLRIAGPSAAAVWTEVAFRTWGNAVKLENAPPKRYKLAAHPATNPANCRTPNQSIIPRAETSRPSALCGAAGTEGGSVAIERRWRLSYLSGGGLLAASYSMRIPGRRPVRVYVDAKILNMHDPSLPKEAYVGYVVDGSGRKNVKRVEAQETDDAEVLAILFAIEELGLLGRFTVVCDHESVVSEARRDRAKNPSELLRRLRETLRSHPKVRLEALQSNPAHQVVTEYVNALKAPAES